jgi:inorganic triphosphatase YgiF
LQEKLSARNSCLEIERKFVVPEDFRQLLDRHGFSFVSELEEAMHDKYYDTHEHHLLHMVSTLFRLLCFSFFFFF